MSLWLFPILNFWATWYNRKDESAAEKVPKANQHADPWIKCSLDIECSQLVWSIDGRLRSDTHLLWFLKLWSLLCWLFHLPDEAAWAQPIRKADIWPWMTWKQDLVWKTMFHHIYMTILFTYGTHIDRFINVIISYVYLYIYISTSILSLTFDLLPWGMDSRWYSCYVTVISNVMLTAAMRGTWAQLLLIEQELLYS